MDSQVEEIKKALNIATVIQEYVPSLKQTGRNYFGLCPFHSERTPSFSVSPDIGIYKCFGCGEGGDIFTFIEKIEHLEFREALVFLAKKAGITIKSYDNEKSKAIEVLKDRAIKASKLAASFYHYILLNHTLGKPGLEYLVTTRKITLKEIEQYKLGYAPKGYHHLQNFLLKKGFTQAELITFGLLVDKEGKVYDKFRERIIHPIHNVTGNIVGFSGRIISTSSLAPKYLNSPETIIYHKSELLYGLYQAKEAIKESGIAIIVEGNFDVISSAKIGVSNIVCPLGTALTAAQLELIKRYTKNVYFCFDNDTAGRKALLRSLELAEKEQITAKAIDIKTYKDVDELISKEPESWKESIKDALDIPDYILTAWSANYSFTKPDDKIAFINLVIPFLAKLQNQVKIDHYLQKLEHLTGTKYEILVSNLHKVNTTSNELSTLTEAEISPTQIKISKKLKMILSYIYLNHNVITNKQELKDLYADNLTPYEVALLKSALYPHMPLTDPLSSILAEKIKLGEILDQPELQIKTMLKDYVKARLQKYLLTLKTKDLTVTNEESNSTDILRRISTYTRKIAELNG